MGNFNYKKMCGYMKWVTVCNFILVAMALIYWYVAKVA